MASLRSLPWDSLEKYSGTLGLRNLGILLVTGFIFIKVIELAHSLHYHSRRARELGCRHPQRIRPNRLPLGVDSVIRMMKADNHHQVPEELHKIYLEQGNAIKEGVVNTWKESKFGVSHYVTVEPRNIQAILATQFNDFEVGRRRFNVSTPLLGKGIFILDGKGWETARTLLRPQFARSLVSDLDLEERHVQSLFNQLSMPGSDGWTKVADIKPLFFNLTLDTATEFLFGESLHSQLQTSSTDLNKSPVRHGYDLRCVAEAIDTGLHDMAVRIRLGELYWLYNPKSWRESIRLCHGFTDTYIQLLLDKGQEANNSEGGGERGTKYVFLNELAKSTQDAMQLRSQTLAVLMAGRDTTASLLCWIFWMLARHPAVLKRLRQCVHESFGACSEPNITFESLKSCKYLQYVINETNRTCTILPFNVRVAAKDTSLPLGGGPDGTYPLYIKKGAEVQFWPSITHTREDIWGPDAKEFNPDRWEGRKPGFEFLPFLAGPRICLGQQLALTEAAYVVVRFLQRFDQIESTDKSWERFHHLTVTDAPMELPLRFHDAGM
ncbi:uncharacterized protein Z520_02852 [Fonsecaea multimorphosa CBS 102226]|uniref:Cytochrome P450 n=1 Tax=Fonsecaea multimorphosa CBS 102226 TaxID=1442371 RepID=A0A0D2KDJ5_9EURO|nr:uncharacterized protein Z520_02852 [Fonsecaea multimorphosa CBS 102226]KIY01300.1 hypothetical protein Z520_02852 [Fonsecaea multimorphosa CBS 102226]OAL28577.1 hypothetical protein AYO22_02771 [Fonsecaea multimorphosa]